MQKNGILDLYVSHASHQITKYEKAKKPAKISRALIELELLIEIDKASFPIEFKMAWYNAVSALCALWALCYGLAFVRMEISTFVW